MKDKKTPLSHTLKTPIRCVPCPALPLSIDPHPLSINLPPNRSKPHRLPAQKLRALSMYSCEGVSYSFTK